MSYSGYSQFTTNLFGSEQYGGGTTASVFGGYQGSWATPAASNHQNQTAPTHYYEQHHTSSVQQPTAATVDSYQQQQYGAGYGGGFGSSSVFGSSSQSRPTNIYENRGRPILGATVGNGFANESRHHQYGNSTGFALESSAAPRPLFGANTFEGRTFSAARSAAAAPFSSRGGISGLSTSSSSKFGGIGGSNSNSSSRPWRSSIFSSTSTTKPNFPSKSKAAPAVSRLRGGSATTALVPVRKATTSSPKKTATVQSNSSKSKKNDSPPKSTAAKKIAAVLAKKQQAADQAKPKQETPAAAVDKIKPAKQSFSKAKGRGGVQKNQSPKKQKFLQQQRPGPNFGPGGMNGYGYGGRGGYSMWGGRGGGGRYGGGQKRFMRKRANQQSDIPFTAVPEGEPFVAFPVSSDNIMCFHGFQSVFTTQHMFPVLIDGNIYESCDHYYQIEKTKQLCGQTSEKMTATVRDAEGKRLDGKVGPRSHEEKGFSALAKEIVRLANVSKEKVEEWRHTNGLEIMQKALRAKVSQCPEMRDALRQSGDKILIHCYPGDAIYGSGTRINGVKAWCDELKKNETKLIVPMRFPLTVTSIEHCPVVGKGRNVLGVIMMQLRNLVMTEEIDIIDMSMIFDGLIPSPAPVAADASKDVDDEMNGFAIGGGSIQPPIGTA